jgi:hypothetical protein
MKPLFLFFSFLFAALSSFAQFEAGDKVRLSEPYPDDIYMAGGEISIDAPVGGDCVVAGGNISINDSIAEDLIVGGGEIEVRGVVGDDIRAAGGTLEIDSEVMDDLIIFGGQVKITERAIIHGNLVSFGGELDIDGTVLGSVKASGGEIAVGGTVHGPSSFSSGDLDIKEGARFLSDVNYWTENGEVNFGGAMENGQARYDESLSWEGNDYSDTGTLVGVGILFTFVFLLGGFLMILLLEWAFGRGFSQSARAFVSSWTKSLGLGVVYVIGLPIAVVVSFMIVIGIPVGLVALVFYLFSMIFGNFVAALILAHLWKDRQGKDWGIFLTALVALMIAIGLHLLTSIPFLGFLISFVVLSITYGAIILAIRGKDDGTQGAPAAASFGGVG